MGSAEHATNLGDESEFAALFERHRGELQVHSYRMLGSLEDSEDLVQETFLRAWRGRASFGSDGRFAVRAWLFRIATNACLDVLRSRPRRVLPPEVAPPAGDPAAAPSPPADLPWLQPYPDRLLEPIASADDDPASAVVARETIELAFIAAIQHLPPRQRAVLILRDVLGWSANDTALLLEGTRPRREQRAATGPRDAARPPGRTADGLGARPRSRARTSARCCDATWTRTSARTPTRSAELLREDARLTMPPHPTWYAGREAIMVAARQGFDPEFGQLRSVATGANLQPAAAHYLRRPGESEYRPLAVDVLRIERGQVAEITSFVSAELFEAFGLPPALVSDDFLADLRSR